MLCIIWLRLNMTPEDDKRRKKRRKPLYQRMLERASRLEHEIEREKVV
jgi:hypothetical protein